jgi:hypothetical protein
MRYFRILLLAAAALTAFSVPATARAQVYISLMAPPLLPDYTQPALTQPNEIWQPGYWAWGTDGYYWVPGTWVEPPQTGLYWTPGYWGTNTNGAGYMWNPGYWGQQVGYYGGVNYGYGYYGNGYVGGMWNGPTFRYNTAVNAVNPQYVRNVYVNRTVVVRRVYRYSYNGPGGYRVRPTAREIAISRERHVPMTAAQRAHLMEARADRNMYVKYNHGKPAEAAVAKPYSATHRPADFKPVTNNTEAKKQAVHSAPKETMHPMNKSVKPPSAAKQPAASKSSANSSHSTNKPPERMQPNTGGSKSSANKASGANKTSGANKASSGNKPPNGNAQGGGDNSKAKTPPQ